MTDQAFQDMLGQLFETPANRTAEPRLTAQVMQRVAREQRLRGWALGLSGLGGLALTLVALVLSGGVLGLEHVGDMLLRIVSAQPVLLSAAVVAAATAAALTQRLLREA